VDRDIQPRTVPEILDAGFRLYRRHFGLLIVISLATTLPLREPQSLIVTPSDLLPFVSSLLIASLLSTLKGWVVTAALTGVLLGQRPSLRAMFDRFLPALPVLILRYVGFVFVLGFATLAFLVPGILLYLAWLFYSQVVIVEGPGVPAFRRSAELTRGQRGRLGILVTLAGLLVASLVLGFTVMGQLLHMKLASVFFTYASTVLVGPLQSTILLVAYFDLRARREGFDLKLRSEALGSQMSASASVA
jgi:hypothetical protein